MARRDSGFQSATCYRSPARRELSALSLAPFSGSGPARLVRLWTCSRFRLSCSPRRICVVPEQSHVRASDTGFKTGRSPLAEAVIVVCVHSSHGDSERESRRRTSDAAEHPQNKRRLNPAQRTATGLFSEFCFCLGFFSESDERELRRVESVAAGLHFVQLAAVKNKKRGCKCNQANEHIWPLRPAKSELTDARARLSLLGWRACVAGFGNSRSDVRAASCCVVRVTSGMCILARCWNALKSSFFLWIRFFGRGWQADRHRIGIDASLDACSNTVRTIQLTSHSCTDAASLRADRERRSKRQTPFPPHAQHSRTHTLQRDPVQPGFSSLTPSWYTLFTLCRLERPTPLLVLLSSSPPSAPRSSSRPCPSSGSLQRKPLDDPA